MRSMNMTLYKINASNCILIEDDHNKVILPLISELITLNRDKEILKILCYEQPISVWKKVFRGEPVQCFKDSQLEEFFGQCGKNCVYVIDSVNQMILDIGWNSCLKYLRRLLRSSSKVILVIHRDCLINHKIMTHLNYLATAVVSFDGVNSQQVRIQIKKGGKLLKSDEILLYDIKTSTVKLTPVVKEVSKVEAEKILPNNLSTFKIEIDQLQQLEKNKLKLPYMNKINDGQSKVYYEPDAVDDWDDEDPDDDLDI